MNIRKSLVLISMAVMMLCSRAAFAAEANIRQPLSNDGSTPGADTITSEKVGSKTALDVSLASGTVNVGTVTATVLADTTPMDTAFQATPVTLAGTATGTISCGSAYNSIILSHDGAESMFYSYTTDGSTGKRMIMYSREKWMSPEGLKVTFTSANIYNPTAVSVTFYLECWK